MVDDARGDDVRRRLHQTAPAPTVSPDIDGIRRGIGRRRLVRRGIAGVAALVMVSGLAVAALDQNRTDDVSEVEVVDEPGTTVPPEDEDEDGDPDDGTEAVQGAALAPEGIAVEVAGNVRFFSLDGTHLTTAKGTTLANEELPFGLRSTFTNVLPLRGPDGGIEWYDPASGLVATFGPHGGPPLWGGEQVASDPEGGIHLVPGHDGDGSSVDEWTLSSDHRHLTVVGEGYYDSLDDSRAALSDGCWVAASGDPGRVDLCDGGARVHVTGSTSRSVPVPDHFGSPRVATAAWTVGDDVVIRTEHDSCFAADAMVLRGDALEPLLGPVEQQNPSSAPIGVAADGRAIVHLNAAACDATAAEPGVYLVDMETGERELVWAGSAQLWEVRAWTTLPLGADDVEQPVEPEPVEHVVPLGGPIAPEEIGRDLLMFGSAGISRVADGEQELVLDSPVVQAYEDGSGGLLFVPPGGGVFRLPADRTSATQWINHRAQPHIWAVGDVDGEAAAWITTLPTEMTETGPTVLPETEQTLAAWLLDGGGSIHIGVTGDGRETGLDGVALLPDGRALLSTCHLQCGLRWASDLDGHDPALPSGWIGGLDAADDATAVVRFVFDPESGTTTNPVLEVRAVDGDVRAEVPIPDDIGWLTHIDLSDDGTAALVWSSDPEDGTLVGGPFYVTGLDAAEPRVHPVATDQGLRFS